MRRPVSASGVVPSITVASSVALALLVSSSWNSTAHAAAAGQAPGVAQPYNQAEPYYDQFKMVSLNFIWNMGFGTLTVAPAYRQRFVYQSTDATEALQNTQNVTQWIQSLYVETDPTTQPARPLSSSTTHARRSSG